MTRASANGDVTILGVHDGHNAAACLYRNGKIIAALQEERIRRIKNWSGTPLGAIRWVMNYAGTNANEIDVVALNGEYMPRPQTKEELLEQYRTIDSLKYQLRKRLRNTPLRTILTRTRQQERSRELMALGFPRPKIQFVNHHQCHAAAAYYGWGRFNEPVLVLTNDGAGDMMCATVNIGEHGRIRTVDVVEDSHSLANIYAVVTFLMGMVPLEHEYKIMGMAPYADQKGAKKIADLFEQHFAFRMDNPITWRRTSDMPDTFYSYPYLRDLLALHRFDAIMGGVQQFTERMLTQWVRRCVAHTGIRKVALSGGIFMNVKANKLIMELPEIDDLFIYPSCGDETNAIGVCYKVYVDKAGLEGITPLEDFYFGPSFDESSVLESLQSFQFGGTKVCYQKSDNIEANVADLLNQGEIVARFSGREEFGARSLGNRAILANPSRVDLIRVLNDMIKSRDFWMPFACSINEEFAGRYLKNPKNISAPYMILSFDTTENVAEISAGIHPYDNTVRPQIVSRSHNPQYHKLISEFNKRSNIGAVLNTSFNLHGFPIVHTPSDALEVFNKSGLRFLAIEDYLIWKM